MWERLCHITVKVYNCQQKAQIEISKEWETCLLSLCVCPLEVSHFSSRPLLPAQTASDSGHPPNQTETHKKIQDTRQRDTRKRIRMTESDCFKGTIHMWQKSKQRWDSKCFFCFDLCKPPTMPLPLQTTASIFLGKQSSALSVLGCLLLCPPPFWLHVCRLVTSGGSWSSSRVQTSLWSNLSLSTFILMQLPAFLRALTASRWVAPCMLRPLTWMDRGDITLLVPVEVRAGVRGGEGGRAECTHIGTT